VPFASRKALLIFMKYPEAGKVKTRLGKDIGEEKASQIFQKLARRNLGIASDFRLAHGEVDLYLYYYPPEKKAELNKAYPGAWKFIPQAGRHLGEKMSAAFQYVFELGYRRAVLIGVDIADLTVIDSEEAFRGLEENQAVLGPSRDGGFYLIGMKSRFEKVFNFSSWSTPSVYERTLNCFRVSGRIVKILSMRTDIDRGEDLIDLKDKPFFQGQISIIIPFSGKIKRLATLIDILEAQLWPGDEIIIVKAHPQCTVDLGKLTCGKADWGPVSISSRTCLVPAPRGRGIQLNRGSSLAKGDLLWFLHADSVPPFNFGYHIRKLTRSPELALGCFELSLGNKHIFLRLISNWANLRTKYLKLPYGDQGLFCSRHTFSTAGGFKRRFIMEDVDFVRACKKVGKLFIIPERLYSSPGRYLKRGILRASCENHLFMLLYFLGASDRRIYSLYYGKD
jgi:rSAM/selenodomain-associated transferase 1